MRSNKEDFSLIIPYVRFTPQNKPDNLLLLDTSVIIDGRIADLIEAKFLEGTDRGAAVCAEGTAADRGLGDPMKRARGRRGLEMLNRIQRNTRNEVKIHDGGFPGGKGSGCQAGAPGAEPERQAVHQRLQPRQDRANCRRSACVNLHELAKCMRTVLLPGEIITLRMVREGQGQGPGRSATFRTARWWW